MLDLANNNFNGSLPNSIGGLISVNSFNVNGNKLTGPIPSTISQMSSLTLLFLCCNEFSGAFPPLGSLTNLTYMELHQNQWQAELPSDMATLTKLSQIYLRNSQIIGTIPSYLGDMPSLQTLDLRNNLLTGCVSLKNKPWGLQLENNQLCCQDIAGSSVLGVQSCTAPLSVYITLDSTIHLNRDYYSQLIIEGTAVLEKQNTSVGCLSLSGQVQLDLSLIMTNVSLSDVPILRYQCNQSEINSDFGFDLLLAEHCNASYSTKLATNQLLADIEIFCVAPNAEAPAAPTDVPMSNTVTPGPNEPQSEVRADVIVPAVVVPVVGLGAGVVGLIIGLKKRRQKKQSQELAQLNNPTHTSPYQSIAPSSTPTISKLASQSNRLLSYDSIKIEKELGSGSYGKVYLGTWQATKVAIKVGNSNVSNDQFMEEAELQMNIPPHPNIVQLLGISMDGPQPLVVLEYCNEGSLDKLLFETNKSISPIELASDIARGLLHLHANNIVHRDLAVRNILMHRGVPKISDFGLSRKLKEEAQTGKTASNIGPIRWMAPESIAAKHYSKSSDVWMFGIILYELVARTEPHHEEDMIDIAVKIRDTGFHPTIPENCPLMLKELMDMCWQMDPSMRPTMEGICKKLEECVE
jgi:hypothetical protein